MGKFLEMSGGAFKLASGALKVVGKKNIPLAMSFVGYVVSIPVFCDSAFIVLSPLVKAISRKLKISLAMLAIALSLGKMSSSVGSFSTTGSEVFSSG
ncbi:MAG TPA: hypothetical protein VLB84_02470 [Bacteroidia bacterium]|nr:hypothetical protein [Bacteroidia bacterium]